MDIKYNPENSNTGNAISLLEIHNRCESISKYNDPVPHTLDTEFTRDGRRWRVKVITDLFIIATAVNAKLDKHGEVLNAHDIKLIRI